MNVKRDINKDLKWDLYQRLRLIEMVALWEGRLTTKSLNQAFGRPVILVSGNQFMWGRDHVATNKSLVAQADASCKIKLF